MTRADLQPTIIEALTGVAPEIDPSALDPDVNFRDQFELDSVDYLNFVLDLEQRLGVRIPELDYPRLSCLSGGVSYLEALLGNAHEREA
jgi:acyl carrier protein